MIVLGIESATVEVGVAIGRDGIPVASMVARPGRRHVETLHPALAAVCTAAGVGLRDIDAVGVDVGPGLFTGLRVGIASAKALALALDVPLVGVRSTEILVRAASLATSPVVPVVDMRRGDVAWELGEEGPSIGPPGELAQQLSLLEGEWFLVGDGARRYLEVFSSCAAVKVGSARYDAPDVTSLVELATERLVRGESDDPYSLEPMYLRAADATANFATRHAIGTS